MSFSMYLPSEDAAFVEGGADGLNESVDVFLEEELAMAEDAAGVVDEGALLTGLVRCGMCGHTMQVA